ncbi:MAG: DUF3368 domain-containing protein [Vicinamibacteria bacterium]|nr:DUF3368 domain-containing protein [Vicinamibacteria bacterium]
MPDVAIVDASCLIVLGRAGRIDLLGELGTSLLVPEAVAAEVRAHPDGGQHGLLESGSLCVVPDPPVPRVLAGWDLGPGETSVLACALAQSGLAVLDDFAARRCAKVVGVPTIGTLGLALRARASGRVPAARPLIEALRDAGLYLSDGLVQEALALVGE